MPVRVTMMMKIDDGAIVVVVVVMCLGRMLYMYIYIITMYTLSVYVYHALTAITSALCYFLLTIYR